MFIPASSVPDQLDFLASQSNGGCLNRGPESSPARSKNEPFPPLTVPHRTCYTGLVPPAV